MRYYTRYTYTALYVIAAIGCGSLGADPASDEVPNAGVVGWRRLPQISGTSIREPFVVCPDGADGFRAPSVVPLAGGGFRLWYTTPAGLVGTASGGDGIYDWAVEANVPLPGAAPYAEVGVARGDDDFLLAGSRADGSGIELYTSSDGIAWTAVTTLLPQESWESGNLAGAEPMWDRVNETWLLFYAGASGGGIGRAVSADGITWTRDAMPLFTLADVQSSSGWPVVGLGSPGAGLDTTRPGDPVYKIWFEGMAVHGPFPARYEPSIGFAGSFDGAAWTLYAQNPVFASILIDVPGKEPLFGDESAPSVVHLPGDDYLMYFEQPYQDPVTLVSRPCIALALTP